MATDVPLLNDYKRAFVRGRLLQTLLGGVRLTGCPWYAVILQVATCAPSVTLAVICATTAEEESWREAVAFGFGVAAYAVLLQVITSLCIKCRKNSSRVTELSRAARPSSGVGARRRRDLFSEEEVHELDGWCGAATWKLIVPPKRHKINVLVHAAVAGVCAAVCLDLLHYPHVRPLFDDSAGARAVIVFGWCACANALFGAVLGPAPPETATYRPLDSLELGALSRPVHLLVLSAPHLVLRLWPSAQVEEEPWRWLNRLCHVLIAFAPALWLLGVLPPVETLVLWLGEQVQQFAFGGATAASQVRFWCYLVLSGAQYGALLLFAAPPRLESGHFVTLCATTGYCLSLDLVGLAHRLTNRRPVQICTAPIKSKKTASSGKSKNENLNQFAKLSRVFLAFNEVITHCIVFGIVVVILQGVTYDTYEKKSQEDTMTRGVNATNDTDRSSDDLYYLRDVQLTAELSVLGWISTALYVIIKLSNELQKVYLLFGTVRSPLYAPAQSETLLTTLWHHIRSLIVNVGVGLFLTFYAKSLFLRDDVFVEDPMPTWVEVLAVIRTMRWIWQDSTNALIEFTIFHLLFTFMASSASPGGILEFLFLHMSHAVQLAVIGVLRDRSKQILEKLYFAVTLSASSLEDRASRRSYSGCLFQANVLFFPLVLFFAGVAALISAPMLSFLTLPVFFVAFPRPLRFWPDPVGLQANHSCDSVYYKQLMDSFITAVHNASRAGRLGFQPAGSMIIGRYEDRIVWLQVLELGNNYVYYMAKGMELQETSCHSLEATRLDDIFEETFEKNSAINRYVFHTVTPLASLPVLMYSDAKNVLTGVIEAKETLHLIARTFLKTLAWFLLKEVTSTDLKRRRQSSRSAATANSDDNVVVMMEDDGIQASQLPRSRSIEAVELDEWPSSSNDGDHAAAQWATTISTKELNDDKDVTLPNRRSSAYHRSSVGSNSPSLLDNLSDVVGEAEEDVILKETSNLKRKTTLPPIRQSLNRTDSMDSLSRRLDNIFLPGGVNERTPQPTRKNIVTDETVVSPARLDSVRAGRRRQYSSDLASEIAPDPTWTLHLEAPANLQDRILANNFSRDWLKLAVGKYARAYLNTQGAEDIDSKVLLVQQDDKLLKDYWSVICKCFFAAYGIDNSFEDLTDARGPGLPVKIFQGDVDGATDDLTVRVILPAYRAAVKLSLDQVLIGAYNSHSELVDELEIIENDWHIGPENDPAWEIAVEQEIPNLFSISSTESSGGRGTRKLYRSRLLSLRDCMMSVGRLNPEVVKGLWASLNLELLYLTNDDDERYSIQAEERLLRNLTVQAADPPLGYTIYSSGPVRKGIETLLRPS